MDKAERDIRSSRFLIRTEDLIAYIREIECRLVPDYCADLRTYVLRAADFNAMMAPNGMMQIWTGLILRCRSEAQLAAVVAHEAGHYLNRHSLARFKDLRDKAAVGTFFGIGLAIAGLGPLAPLAQAGVLSTTFAFSRDQEREADALSLMLLARAGYPPAAAASVWQQFLDELQASTAEKRDSLFFATHPSIEERLQEMKRRADALGGDTGDWGRERYLARIQPILPLLLADELRLRQYGRTEVVIRGWLEALPESSELHHASGELYRLRRQPGDAERAQRAYERAVALPAPPAEAWRGMGLVSMDQGDTNAARAAFDKYLQVAPPGADLETVRTLMKDLSS